LKPGAKQKTGPSAGLTSHRDLNRRRPAKRASVKALVILNPIAGNNESRVLYDALSRHFAEARIEYEVYETRSGDRLAEIVRQRVREGFDLVVVAGGDGTVSAAGDGLLGGPIPLGIIPAGTGNLVARELDIPDEVEAAVALIAGVRRTRKIDAMRIGRRAYLLNASIGISASVIGGTTRRSKSRFGRIAYIGTALLKVLSSRPRYLMIDVDGKKHPYRAVEVGIMNCGLLSRLIYPRGPEIRIDDGHLGIWILSMETIWDYIRYLIGILAGRTLNREAHFIRAEKTVSIRSRIPLSVQADGDIIGTTPIDVEVLPGMLTVLVSGKPVIAPKSSSPIRGEDRTGENGLS
jgi:diacylglycerol kinase (ATP)